MEIASHGWCTKLIKSLHHIDATHHDYCVRIRVQSIGFWYRWLQRDLSVEALVGLFAGAQSKYDNTMPTSE